MQLSLQVFEMIQNDPNVIFLLFSGAWGKMIHEKKTYSKKSHDTVTLI